jgi:hypothetical protein
MLDGTALMAVSSERLLDLAAALVGRSRQDRVFERKFFLDD